MLSEEEKQAMKYFYNLRATIDESNMLFDEDIDVKCGKETIKQITTILNLIEKQSKEIEELKNGQIDFWISDKEIEERIRNKFVSKDKIKAKIDELDKQEEDLQNIISNEEREEYSDANISWELMDIQIRRDILQSLLEEEE